MELAIAEKPELFNHIQFSFEDSRYDPKYGKYFDFPIVLKTIINNKVEELK